MEVAVIDWKSIDSRFVKDEVYENINAPQWVDFSAPDASVNDESWFCRPGNIWATNKCNLAFWVIGFGEIVWVLVS